MKELEKLPFKFQSTFVNEFGEKMVLIYDNAKRLFIYHDDFTDGFEDVDEIIETEIETMPKEYKGQKFFKYLLDESEKEFFMNFINLVGYAKKPNFINLMEVVSK